MADFRLLSINEAEVQVEHDDTGFVYIFTFVEEYGRAVLSRSCRIMHDLSAGADAFQHVEAAYKVAIAAALAGEQELRSLGDFRE